jgi:hypothetical protein
VPVLENSVIEFIERWKHHASRVTLYPQLEGSPLLEISAAGRVLYVLDRVGPYAAKPGETSMIVNPMTETVFGVDLSEPSLTITGISGIEAVGSVLEVSRDFVVIQARLPLVVGVLDQSWKEIKVGQTVSFVSLEPIHGFLTH